MTQTARSAGPATLDGPVDPDYPIDPVPAHARKSLFSLAIVLLGFTFFTPTMLAGAQIGAAFRFGPLLAVLVLGSVVLGVYVAVLGAIGARTGLTTVLMARYSFGDKGSKLVSLLLGGTQVGWYGVTVAVLAQLTAQALGWESSGAEIFNSPTKKPFVVGGVVLGTLLAITGIYDNLIQYLVWLGILIPPVGGVIIGDFLARWRHGVPDVATHDFPAVQWGNVGAYALGSLVAWASQEFGWGIPPVNGILVALVAATVVSRSAGTVVRARG